MMLRGKKTILFEISRLGKFELARAVNLVSFVYTDMDLQTF